MLTRYQYHHFNDCDDTIVTMLLPSGEYGACIYRDNFDDEVIRGVSVTRIGAIADLIEHMKGEDEDDGLDSEGYPIGSPREWSEEELKELRRRERACDDYGN